MPIRIENMGASGTSDAVVGETPAEAPNGVIVLFTLPDAYVAGTLKVYRDQLTLQPAVDFEETSPDDGTFTVTSAPETGEAIWCDYSKQ